MNFSKRTKAKARFAVKYFSADGVRVVEADCMFLFCVTEDAIYTFTGEADFDTTTGGNYFPALNNET
jgi:hypothetical protein